MEYKTIISIHALTGSATYIMTIFSGSTSLFQSTHPRGVRRANNRPTKGRYFISIHAPARGATTDGQLPNDEIIISIHAPARGATKNLFGEEQSEKISIHAPARGATYA